MEYCVFEMLSILTQNVECLLYEQRKFGEYVNHIIGVITLLFSLVLQILFHLHTGIKLFVNIWFDVNLLIIKKLDSCFYNNCYFGT